MRTSSISKSYGFTLIELLVVISIITLLVALLLPALARARDASTIATCLGDRRQNGVMVYQYTLDFRDQLPMATSTRDFNGYQGLTVSDQAGSHPASSQAATLGPGYATGYTHEHNTTGTVYPLGTLARRGYVADPRSYYCPAFDRSPQSFAAAGFPGAWGSSWTLDTQPAVWGQISSNTLTWSLAPFRGYTGIVNYWYIPTSNPYITRSYVRLDDIVSSWKRDDLVSPLLISCAQRIRSQAFTVSAQTLGSGVMQSHQGRGVNAVYYDGSARWIGLNEVKSDGWQADLNVANGNTFQSTYPMVFLSNDSNGQVPSNMAVSNFVEWSRKKMR